MTLSFYLNNTATAVIKSLLTTLPVGFQPYGLLSIISPRAGVAGAELSGWNVNGAAIDYWVNSVSNYIDQITWVTADSIPTTLPGTLIASAQA